MYRIHILERAILRFAWGRVVPVPVVPGYPTTEVPNEIREGALASRAQS